MRRQPNDGSSSRGSPDRGLWTPSLAQVVTLWLLVTIGCSAAYVSLAATNPLGVKTEVTTELDDTFVTEDGSVVVTVVAEQSGEPVTGVTVRPTTEVVRLDAAPARTSDAEGTVRFEFGNAAKAIDIDWPAGQQIASVTFEIESGEEYVDRRSNGELTVRRTEKNVVESATSTPRLEDSIGSQRERRPLSAGLKFLLTGPGQRNETVRDKII